MDQVSPRSPSPEGLIGVRCPPSRASTPTFLVIGNQRTDEKKEEGEKPISEMRKGFFCAVIHQDFEGRGSQKMELMKTGYLRSERTKTVLLPGLWADQGI